MSEHHLGFYCTATLFLWLLASWLIAGVTWFSWLVLVLMMIVGGLVSLIDLTEGLF